MRLLFVSLIYLVACASHAAVVIRAIESGPDVVFSLEEGSSLLVRGTERLFMSDGEWGAIIPNESGLFFGAPNVGDEIALYSPGVFGPEMFGPGSLAFASEKTGGLFGFDRFLGPGIQVDLLYLPPGYESGTPLESATLFFENATFTSLGIVPGVYEWEVFFEGPPEILVDSITLIAVPIPSAIWLFGPALCLLGRLRKKSDLVPGQEGKHQYSF